MSVVQLALALYVRNTLIDAAAECARFCARGDRVVLRGDRIASVLLPVQIRCIDLEVECHVIFGVLRPDEVRCRDRGAKCVVEPVERAVLWITSAGSGASSSGWRHGDSG
ncbi:hypothetical protein [Plantibacter sp. ME-Dv--P-095]|uniref:hypothetical protein n=1 Tax=Plantibacter sp. ME-Dv--P-095 TaxID=3040299 RepID=UPI0033056413